MSSTYTVTGTQLKLIEDNFFQWSFGKPDVFVPDREIFARLKHPAELYYLASIYNWDDGPCVLEWIVDSPLCSKATANLIFWRARPDYYRRYELDAVSPEEGHDDNYDVLRILRKIIERHRRNDFHGYKIAFDPKDELERMTEENPKWDVPRALYEKIAGADVLALETWKFILLQAVQIGVVGLLIWWVSAKLRAWL